MRMRKSFYLSPINYDKNYVEGCQQSDKDGGKKKQLLTRKLWKKYITHFKYNRLIKNEAKAKKHNWCYIRFYVTTLKSTPEKYFMKF